MTENETEREPLWLTVFSWVGGIVTVAFIALLLWPYAPAMFEWTRDHIVLPTMWFFVWLRDALAQLLGWVL